ncbi:MAG TPA: hypothetical protein VK963_02145 [Candidatus Saccharimonadales bacterium]|nr:hypothetical protein [Candidatus Saccharimonadales bacterium]
MSCGCKMYDDDMGDPKTVTTKTFDEAATAMGQKKEEAMEETYQALKEVLAKDK